MKAFILHPASPFANEQKSQFLISFPFQGGIQEKEIREQQKHTGGPLEFQMINRIKMRRSPTEGKSTARVFVTRYK